MKQSHLFRNKHIGLRSWVVTVFILFFLMQNSACKKFVEIPPPTTELISTTVFSSDATATAAVLGIYSTMMQANGFASLNTSLYGGLSADELIDYSDDPGQREFYTNSINPSNLDNLGMWSNAYQYIYAANAVITGLQSSSAVSATIKTELQAEAKFIRAFCYFYLTNLYGTVPLIVSTDYTSNALAARNQPSEIYSLIVSDLKEAATNLSAGYVDANNNPTSERIRPIQYTAMALLARVYLFQKDWVDAESMASNVINQSGLYSLDSDLNTVFLKNSQETIWQLQPVNPSFDTYEGVVFILTTIPSGSTGCALSTEVLNAFEPGDLRKTNWTDSISVSGQVFYFAYKYKNPFYDPTVPEYSMVMRLAEQFLIRAEARAEQGNFSGTAQDLNTVRQRAGLTATSATDLPSFLSAILHERQVELFTEWGHRWLDLKRTGEISSILTPIKPGWNPTDSLYPVPVTEIRNDPNITQNPGY